MITGQAHSLLIPVDRPVAQHWDSLSKVVESSSDTDPKSHYHPVFGEADANIYWSVVLNRKDVEQFHVFPLVRQHSAQDTDANKSATVVEKNTVITAYMVGTYVMANLTNILCINL